MLVRRVRQIADVGIVNARDDKRDLYAAADLLEALDERVAIMSEFSPHQSPAATASPQGEAFGARLLAAEELRSAEDGGGVYWVEFGRQKCYACLIAEITAQDNFRMAFIVTIRGHMDAPSYRSYMANYGKTWRCWSAKPTEEQRRETPWAVALDDYDEHRHSGLISED